MEYFGKILCISVDDLTRDDRRADKDMDDTQAPIMSYEAYKKMSQRNKLNVVRQGKGLGNYALVEYATLPTRFKDRIKEKYGDVDSDILRNWFSTHYSIDAEARSFYSQYRFSDGKPLPPHTMNEYTVNASVLNAVVSLMRDRVMMRKAMKCAKVNWSEMSGAISYFQEEFGHTLPLSASRFQKKVRAYQKEGYESLISKKFRNQSARKVSYPIERLLLSLDCQPERPYNTTVAEMYNQFIQGALDVYDPETGELLDPSHYYDAKGNPIVLNEKTVSNYLNNSKNKALRAKYHSTAWEFNNKYRPYHLRHRPNYALSKISLDDRDLPRKMHNGQRVKAYYAYDLSSGAVIGYAYSRMKTTDLFIDCVRNMFRMLDRENWYMPAEVEVEHHLVSNFKDGLMKAGVVFPLVRWCNPGNSREKGAEHQNRAKKYSVEKRLQEGIGRWWAKLEANQVKVEKVYDEKNNTYKEKSYDYDELVADDIRAIEVYNHMLHPNQKRYPNMTRWDVLCATQNPELHPVDKRVLYRYIGEVTRTSIQQNTFVQVQYKPYALPSPDVMGELEPRNLKVDAYYLPNSDGKIEEVHLYQNDRYICTCKELIRYNEAKAEQTQMDIAAYEKQSHYIAKFDAMIKKDKIQKLRVLPKDELSTPLPSSPVELNIVHNEDDFLTDFDIDEYRNQALNSL